MGVSVQFRFAYGLAMSAIEGCVCLPRLFPGLGVGPRACHIFFLSRSEGKRSGGIFKSVQEANVLTRRRTFRFSRQRRRGRFPGLGRQVLGAGNRSAASDAHLRISSNMLAWRGTSSPERRRRKVSMTSGRIFEHSACHRLRTGAPRSQFKSSLCEWLWNALELRNSNMEVKR
jgi:hypothetical protein